MQIRDLDDETYAGLQRHAAGEGISVPELLRREAERIARRPTVAEWLARTRRRHSPVTPEELGEALDDLRGPWPSAGS